MKYVLLLALMLSLASCAPAMRPSDPSNPYDIDKRAFVSAEAGSTIYLTNRYSREDLNISYAEIRNVRPDLRPTKAELVTRKGREVAFRTPVDWLILERQSVSESWRVRIDRQEFAIDATYVYNRAYDRVEATEYQKSVYVIYAVEVPEDVRGINRITLDLYSKPGEKTETVSFTIDVQEALDAG